MAKIQSDIRSANRHIQQIADLFGVESAQYQTAKKQMLNAFRYVQGAVYYNKEGILKIHQSKSVYEKAAKQAESIRKIQKKTGSAALQAKEYKTKLKEQGKKGTKEEIREEARREYEEQRAAESYYFENRSDIRADEELYKQWKKAGENATFIKGVVNTEYEKAVNMTNAKKKEKKEQKKTETTYKK